jgi:hypothetical protein
MSSFTKMPPITIDAETTLPLIHAFAADREGVYQDHIEEEDSRNLKGCLGTLEEGGIFFRSESLDTPQKALQFSRITRFAYQTQKEPQTPFRCTCCQMGVIDLEADLIMNQHLYVVKLNNGKTDPVSFAHIFLPTEPLYYTPLRKRLFSTSLNDLETISHEVSYEGIATYAYWLSEEVDKVVPTFNYSATEEYELEKRLKDFIHQARSEVLKTVKTDIIKILRQLDKLMGGIQGRTIKEAESEQLIDMEKKLIHAREELKGYTDSILGHLHEVQVAIEKIAVAHPELEQLYYSTILLKRMMQLWNLPFKKWAQKNLVHSMLDHQLNVITFFNSYQNDNRSLFSFAVRYALFVLRDKDTESDLLDIVLNWYELSRRLHRHHLDIGNYPPRDRKLKLVYDLRYTVFQVYNVIRKGSYIVDGSTVNTEFLTLLPVFVKSKEGEFFQLLEIDTQTFDVIDFKENIEEILQKIT